MIIYLSQKAHIGINEHGTAVVQCPLCGRWYKALNLSRHIENDHQADHQQLKAEAAAKKREAKNV